MTANGFFEGFFTGLFQPSTFLDVSYAKNFNRLLRWEQYYSPKFQLVLALFTQPGWWVLVSKCGTTSQRQWHHDDFQRCDIAEFTGIAIVWINSCPALVSLSLLKHRRVTRHNFWTNHDHPHIFTLPLAGWILRIFVFDSLNSQNDIIQFWHDRMMKLVFTPECIQTCLRI